MTYEECKRWLEYDQHTGVFVWTGRWDGDAGKIVAGHVGKGGYRWIAVGGKSKTYHAARVAVLWMTGSWPAKGMEVDHINGNKSDNRWVNLRVVTHAENSKNKRLLDSNTSGVVGVREGEPYVDGRSKWRAEINVDGRYIDLYRGPSFEEAVRLRKEAEVKYRFHPNNGREY